MEIKDKLKNAGLELHLMLKRGTCSACHEAIPAGTLTLRIRNYFINNPTYKSICRSCLVSFLNEILDTTDQKVSVSLDTTTGKSSIKLL